MQINVLFLSLILFFRYPFELIWINQISSKSEMIQHHLKISTGDFFLFIILFLLLHLTYVAQNPFSCGDFDVD
jgi:hypothetical protein